MTESEKCRNNSGGSGSADIIIKEFLTESESNSELKIQSLNESTVLLLNNGNGNSSDEVAAPTHLIAVSNTSTISDLESKLMQRDNEINNLTKLAAKYKRQLEKANKYNEELRNELFLLSSELHNYRCQSFENKSVDTQVTEAEIDEAYGNKPMPEWRTDSSQGLGELSIADSLKATAEAELQNQLATSYLQTESEQQTIEADSEYVLDPSTGLYYHPSTGYYWDPNYELFYDNTTGTYYQYNEKNGEYEIHSQFDMTGQSEIYAGSEDNSEKIKSKDSRHRKIVKNGESRYQRVKRKLKKNVKSSEARKVKHRRNIKENELETAAIIHCDMDKNEVEDMKDMEKLNSEQSTEENCRVVEMVDSTEYDSESSGSLATGESELMSEPESGELTSESSSSDVEMLGVEALPVLYNSPTELAEDYPPCIRMIVQSSEHLKCGSLYIITCTGGSIGRDKNNGHAIEIDDINVSKLHAEIAYDYEKHCYSVSDKGSQNGTILNGNRLSHNKSESDCHELHHDDVLQIGSTTFLLHIHKGNETCDSCEPGQVQAKLKAACAIKNDYVILSQEEKNRQRKKELKNIKKKYGLQNSYYEISGVVNTNSDFCDKAYMRRKFIGSESEFFKQDVVPASVQSPISAQNKGHKLLAKMGWKEGQGLGKTSSGIAEPINVELRVNQTAGLGSTTGVSLSLDNVQHTGKAKRWAQARNRFEKLKGNKKGTQASSSSQISSIKTGHASHNRPCSKSLPVHPESLDSRDAFSAVGSASELDITVLSTTTNNHSSLPNEATNTSGIQNPLYNKECVQQTSQAKVNQQRSKMSWISGGTEQTGLLLPPKLSFPEDTEST